MWFVYTSRSARRGASADLPEVRCVPPLIGLGHFDRPGRELCCWFVVCTNNGLSIHILAAGRWCETREGVFGVPIALARLPHDRAGLRGFGGPHHGRGHMIVGTCANQQQSGRPRCSTDARVKLEPATGSRTAKINARARHYCGTSLPHRFLRCDASFAQLHSVTAYSLWLLNTRRARSRWAAAS